MLVVNKLAVNSSDVCVDVKMSAVEAFVAAAMLAPPGAAAMRGGALLITSGVEADLLMRLTSGDDVFLGSWRCFFWSAGGGDV